MDRNMEQLNEDNLNIAKLSYDAKNGQPLSNFTEGNEKVKTTSGNCTKRFSLTNTQQRLDKKGHLLALTAAKKHEQYHYEKPRKKGFLEKLKINFNKQSNCSWTAFKELIYLRIPMTEWLINYDLKNNLIGDAIAGITVAVMHIPQGMAYALLVHLDAISGIYMAFFPVLFYSIFASSKHCSMGSFALICLMTGKVVSEFAFIPDSVQGGILAGNLSLVEEMASDRPHLYSPIEVSSMICLSIAIWMFIFGFLNLGVLTVFLSDMLVSGFTTGAAFQVLVSQMRALFGMKTKTNNGPFHALITMKHIFEKILEANPATVIMSFSFIGALTIYNELIKPYVAKVTRIPVPIELIAVISGTLIDRFWNLNGNYGLEVVGQIPTGFPSPTLPAFELLGKVFIPSLTIAVVSFSVSFSMAKILANKCDYSVDAKQELFATGIGNIVGSLFQCAPISASLSRSLIQEAVGGVTQLASIISCSVLSMVLLFIGPFFETLPRCVLAAIIITALKGMFMQVFDFIKMWKISKIESAVWLITFLSVIVVDIDIGLFLGVISSLLILIYKAQTPTITVLGRVPDTDIYLDKDRYSSVNEIPGVKIIQVAGSLHFANIECFYRRLIKASGCDPKAIFKMEVKQEMEKNAGSNDHVLDLETKDIILDMSGVGQIDITGAKNMAIIYKDFAKVHISLHYSSISESCLEAMENCSSLDTIPPIAIFHSIHDAVFCINLLENQKEIRRSRNYSGQSDL